MKRLILICVLFSYFCFSLCAGDDLLRGLDAYSRSAWNEAIQSFEKAFVSAPDDRKEALYWLVLSQASAKQYRSALNYADMFVKSYPDDAYTSEILYQQGRIAHLCGSYEDSSLILDRFIRAYPYHPNIPAAYYWMAENLYEVGHYAYARELFMRVVRDFPESGKVPDARYKIMLIDGMSVAAMQDERRGNTEKTLPAEKIPEKTDVQDTRLDGFEEGLAYERKKNEDMQNRITALEGKIEALSSLLQDMSQAEQDKAALERQQKEQEEAAAREAERAAQQQAAEEQAARERFAREEQEREAEERRKQEELVRLELERRKQELEALQQRARTLEEIYEQRTKGAKNADKK